MILDEMIIAAAGRRTFAVSAQAVAGSASGLAGAGLVRSDAGSGNHATNVVISFGSGSYTFAWANIAQLTGANQTAVNTSVQNPVFQATVTNGVPSSATWRLTVTDLITGLVAQTTIQSDLTWTSTAPPPLTVTTQGVFGSRSGTAPNGAVTSAQGAGNHTTNTTVTGGSGSYSYSWVKLVQTSGGNQTAVNAAVQNPVFQATVSDVTQSIATWQVTVTDLVTGAIGQSSCGCTLTWTQTGGP